MSATEQKFERLFGQRPHQRYARFLTFVDKTPPSHLFRNTALPSLVAMTLGGTVGGLVGLAGGPKGAMVGAGSGAGVGLLAGGTYAGYQARREYKKWIRQYRSDEVLHEFNALINQDARINEFICPLTKELMHLPFSDPWGHSYEKNAIEKWVRKYGTSPVTQKTLQISDLHPNYLLMGKQAKFYSDLLAQEVRDQKLSAIQKHGIYALLRDLEQQIKNCFDAENHVLHLLLRQQKITTRTYVSQLDILVDLFFADGE